MNTTISETIATVAAVTLQNGVLNRAWIRANARGACPCLPISEPILDAARIDALEAETIEKTAPATIRDRPILYAHTGRPNTLATAIAEQVSVSSATVRNRIARLEESGVIEGYHLTINQ
jgi:hypothetical protein